MTHVARNTEHVGMANNVMLCEHCGSRQELTLPQPVESVVALMGAWTKAHTKCRQIPGVSAFRSAASLDAWPESDDTGMSSKAIYRHMTHGFPFGEEFEDGLSGAIITRFPLDPSDFGRCYRLLALAPHWRVRIGEMAQYNAEWKALAEAWDELTALYEEEVGPSHRGSAPRLYARMKALIDATHSTASPLQRVVPDPEPLA